MEQTIIWRPCGVGNYRPAINQKVVVFDGFSGCSEIGQLSNDSENVWFDISGYLIVAPKFWTEIPIPPETGK